MQLQEIQNTMQHAIVVLHVETHESFVKRLVWQPAEKTFFVVVSSGDGKDYTRAFKTLYRAYKQYSNL